MKTFRVILCTEKPGAVVNAIDIKADDFSLISLDKKVYFEVKSENTNDEPSKIAYFNLDKIYGFFDVDYINFVHPEDHNDGQKATMGINSNDDICVDCRNLDGCYLFPNKCEIHKLKESKK